MKKVRTVKIAIVTNKAVLVLSSSVMLDLQAGDDKHWLCAAAA